MQGTPWTAEWNSSSPTALPEHEHRQGSGFTQGLLEPLVVPPGLAQAREHTSEARMKGTRAPLRTHATAPWGRGEKRLRTGMDGPSVSCRQLAE